MIVPKPLKFGSKIGIVSTASGIDEEIIQAAADLLIKDGFQVEIADNVTSSFHQFAGIDAERAEGLQLMIDNPEIEAIICSRGGYGTLRTLQTINWSTFFKYPKWIIGFSDITVIHSKLNVLGVASIHGVMTKHFIKDNLPSESYCLLKSAINGEPLSYSIPASKYNREGFAKGELVGGNLSILYSLRGTPLDLDTHGKILFIEDLSEYLYHLDRMMMNLKTGGKLANLAGLLIGSFTGMKDNDIPFGKEIEEIIFEAVEEYNYPVMFNFPAGHQQNNFAIKMGIIAKLSVEKNLCTFNQN